MNPSAIFSKTDKGHAELKTRSMQLPRQARALLIMVDGNSQLSQLEYRARGLGDVIDTLRQLLEVGLIQPAQHAQTTASNNTPIASSPPPQPVVSTTAAAPAPVATTNAIQAPPRRRSVALARLFLLDIMERTLGSRSDAVRSHLRTATTREELLACFADIKEILVETAGDERAARIESDFLDLLPLGLN